MNLSKSLIETSLGVVAIVFGTAVAIFASDWLGDLFPADRDSGVRIALGFISLCVILMVLMLARAIGEKIISSFKKSGAMCQVLGRHTLIKEDGFSALGDVIVTRCTRCDAVVDEVSVDDMQNPT